MYLQKRKKKDIYQSITVPYCDVYPLYGMLVKVHN